MKALLMMLIGMGVLSGCAERVTEVRGTSIHLVPIQFQFSVADSDPQSARNKLEQFWTKYPSQKDSLWLITSFNLDGDKLAEIYRLELLNKGLDRAQVRMQKSPSSNGFDVEVVLIQLGTELEFCHQEKVGKYGYGQIGCYTDGSRWISMVNPQNAI